MSELVDFLRARLNEDEQAARACPQSRWEVSGPPPGHYAYSATSSDLVGWTGPNSRAILANPTFRAEGTLAHAARHDPARVLRRIAANRDALKRYEDNPVNEWPLFPLYAMVSEYSDHPDFRKEWTVS
jgi:hypothetical protein